MPRLRAFTLAVGAMAWLVSHSVCAASIHEHVRMGDTQEVGRLITANRDLVNSRNELGSTPLHIAAANATPDIASLLLDQGAAVNARDNNGAAPLHIAAFSGHKTNVELLLARGANVHARDNSGKTARDYAYASLSREVSDILLLKMLSTPASGMRK
jgi:ankyrin repeat protein